MNPTPPSPPPDTPATHKIALRHAHVQTILGLQEKLKDCSFGDFGPPKTSAMHLRWMCDELLCKINVFPPDKVSRWVGFVQGVMACYAALDVDAERERTRPLFHAAYFAPDAPKP